MACGWPAVRESADRVWEVTVEILFHHVFNVSSGLEANILCRSEVHHARAHLVVYFYSGCLSIGVQAPDTNSRKS